jgi:DnaD/phage-associated family protein
MIKEYKIFPLKLTSSPAFSEASREELRVLLALIEAEGRFESADALSAAASVSCPRCRSALSFWEESGIITERVDGAPIITEEFEERTRIGEVDEHPALEVADSIRDGNLKSAIDECAMLIGTPSLPTADVKLITALYTQYGLSPEYIVTLAAYLAEKSTKLTARKIVNEGIKLQGNGCDTVEALESYIHNKSTESDTDWEFRRIFGIYNRNLSASEKSYFKKWSEEYGFSVTIVSEAYDKAIMNTQNGKHYLQYMDTVLTAWHKAGCKTLSECRAQSESERAEIKNTQSPRKESKKTPEKPRYGTFDIHDAFQKALERSYGKSDEDDA